MMSLFNVGSGSMCNCGSMGCPRCNPRPGAPVCPPGATGAQGPVGPAGPAAATIPFSFSENGAGLGTDALGNPQIIFLSGFGPTQYANPLYLEEGEWETGTITFRQDMPFGTSFIMPRSAILRNIHVMFSSKFMFVEEGILYPFVCLAVSNTSQLVYTILQDTITYTEPYEGGVEYPKHTLRSGVLRDLNISLPEGALVAIVAGIRGVDVTTEQYIRFTASGGLYLE